jgi:hypothetical protein
VKGTARPKPATPKALTPDQERALQLIALAGGDGAWPRTLYDGLGMNEVRARVLIRPLLDADYVRERSFDFHLILMPKGEEYLVEHNLV